MNTLDEDQVAHERKLFEAWTLTKRQGCGPLSPWDAWLARASLADTKLEAYKALWELVTNMPNMSEAQLAELRANAMEAIRMRDSELVTKTGHSKS